MRGTKTFFAVVVLTAIVGLASVANAQGVKFVGVGSSAMFNTVFSRSIHRPMFLPRRQRLPSLERQRKELWR